MKDRYMLISSIALPLMLCLFIYFIVKFESRPAQHESTYRQMIKLQEEVSSSPSRVLLASDVFKESDHEKDYTRASVVATYLDKLSLPIKQLAQIIDEVELEHTRIIADYRLQNKKFSQSLELNPRYRIVLATYLDINPASLNDQQLKQLVLEPSDFYLLKTLAVSEDFPLLLKEEKLDNEYVQLDNLRKIYGSSHHAKRGISNINEN